MVASANLGFPRIGSKRELKSALEDYWLGKIPESDLLATAAAIRATNWRLQEKLKIDHIPCGDFSLYDHVIDTACMLGAIPDRYRVDRENFNLASYFLMCRGSTNPHAGGNGKGFREEAPLEMTKWFDTNYHYIVPEIKADQQYRLTWNKPLEHFLEARSLGIVTRPVLLGPLSFLHLAKAGERGLDISRHAAGLVEVYAEVIRSLERSGAGWIQLDEPYLVMDLDADTHAAYKSTYQSLRGQTGSIKLLLATYFGPLSDNMDLAVALPVDGLHVDLARHPEELDALERKLPDSMLVSAGVIDGRNVWAGDLEAKLELVERLVQRVGADRVQVAPSCSLLHCPIDLEAERRIAHEVKSWMSFAVQKLQEVAVITRAAEQGREAAGAELAASRQIASQMRDSDKRNNPAVKRRIAELQPEMFQRRSPYPQRRQKQRSLIPLPVLPTTTIGSFPQTREIRKARALFKKGNMTGGDYDRFIKEQIEEVISLQEQIGLDVLVHGEPERTDMVEFFADNLPGMLVTEHGWVQSYGSRCVKPPVIYGDVFRQEPMTVELTRFAQSRSPKPVKGMLTGPVTILQWSFVRDDQPREATCTQIALAIRDEVADLEKAGIKIIQIDEPAIREGLPLRRRDWQSYLSWAVKCFRLSASSVADETAIHTHMCYSEFSEIIESVADLDADAVSIEASRSSMELLNVFKQFHYPNEIGPGVFDIHSPRVPSQEEIESLLVKAIEVIPPELLWVNPDCGLKTRRWEEVIPALNAMVQAALAVRNRLERSGTPRPPLTVT